MKYYKMEKKKEFIKSRNGKKKNKEFTESKDGIREKLKRKICPSTFLYIWTIN